MMGDLLFLLDLRPDTWCFLLSFSGSAAGVAVCVVAWGGGGGGVGAMQDQQENPAARVEFLLYPTAAWW
jgi:hypothetical protein